MDATQKYSVIDPTTGKIDRRIFSDQAIYDQEMERIFGRAWLMIGHESLVPEVNDFFHTYMGEDPVILTRDRQGATTASWSTCPGRPKPTMMRWTSRRWGSSRRGSKRMRASSSPRGPRMPRASRPSWGTRAGTWTPSSIGETAGCRRSAR